MKLMGQSQKCETKELYLIDNEEKYKNNCSRQ